MPAPNPWLDRRVIAYAHQGGAWEAPSSTLFAIRRALASGATAIELDVHATADGELVVCHDATVDRTTDGHGRIAEMTLDQLRRLDNAYWFVEGAGAVTGRPDEAYVHRGRAPDDPELGIATLDQVLTAFPGVVLNLDIKQTGPDVAPYEEALARLLAEHERRDDVIVASFLDTATAAFQEADPVVPTSAGTLATAAFWRALHQGERPRADGFVALQVPERHGDLVVVDQEFVSAAHDCGIAVHVWTVNDADSMGRLLDVGVDGIISDVPAVLGPVLQARGVAWATAASPG